MMSGEKDRPIACFGGLTSAQLEEVYAYFKEKESQEHMTGKSFSAAMVQWVLDNGASHHMTNNASIIRKLVKLSEPIFITTANKVTVVVEQVGTVLFSTSVPNILNLTVILSEKNWFPAPSLHVILLP